MLAACKALPAAASATAIINFFMFLSFGPARKQAMAQEITRKRCGTLLSKIQEKRKRSQIWCSDKCRFPGYATEPTREAGT